MSKSRGNLVFVSKLLAGGTDPMAIRLAILAHHYREDWDWTQGGLAEAQERLGRWRAAIVVASAPGAAVPGAAAPGAAVPGAAAPAASAPAGSGPAGSVPAGSVPAVASGAGVLTAIRERLADDLDAPGALAAVDARADAVLAAPGSATDGGLVRDTVDALLGVLV